MKHAVNRKTIIPKIYVSNRWVYIGEKVFYDNRWIKIDYYEAFIGLEEFEAVTVTGEIQMTMHIGLELIA